MNIIWTNFNHDIHGEKDTMYPGELMIQVLNRLKSKWAPCANLLPWDGGLTLDVITYFQWQHSQYSIVPIFYQYKLTLSCTLNLTKIGLTCWTSLGMRLQSVDRNEWKLESRKLHFHPDPWFSASKKLLLKANIVWRKGNFVIRLKAGIVPLQAELGWYEIHQKSSARV